MALLSCRSVPDSPAAKATSIKHPHNVLLSAGPTYSTESVNDCIKVPTCPIPIRKRSVAKAEYIWLDEGNKAQMEPLEAKRRQVTTKVARLPIKSAIVPNTKLPTNMPAMYRLLCMCKVTSVY